MRVNLGFDVGGSAIKWVRLADGQIAASGSTETPRSGVNALIAAITGVVDAQQAALDDSSPIGLALPASLDPATSGVRAMPNLPGDWEGVRPAELLARATDRQWCVMNDARAFAASELVVGVARDLRDTLAVTVGTGVGGALILEGGLYLGSSGLAGELGHVVVDAAGRRCGCGGTGCMETYVGAAGILAEARRRGVLDEVARRRSNPSAPVSAKDVFLAAQLGDQDARQLTEEAVEALGMVLGRVTTLLSLERIVIGGGLAAGLRPLLPALEAAILRNLRIVPVPQVRIGTLGRIAGAVGAAAWAGRLVPISPIVGRHAGGES